jgi:potassium efflux system protein
LLLVSAFFLPIIGALSIFDYPHQDVRVALKLVYGAIAVVLLLWLINSEHDPTDLIARPGTQLALDLHLWSTIAKPAISLAAIALLVLAFVGYINLASYLARGIVLTALISAAAVPIQRRVARELDERFPPARPGETADAEPVVDTRYMALRYAERVAALVIVVWLLLRAWSVRGYHLAAVIEYASRPLVDVKGTRISVLGIAKGLVVALISYWIARAVRHQIEKSAVLSRKWDEGVRHAIASALYYLIVIAGAMAAILVAGLQLTVLAAFAGMVGIAVGFGSQDIAKNIICGLIIMLDRSINVGDYVDVAGQSGTIVDISIRSITIRTHDNRLVIVPNATFYTQNVVVSSQRDKQIRVTVDLAVAGDTDFDKVTSILTETAAAEEHILPEPPPEVIFSKLAAGALNLQLIAWTDQIDQLPMVQGRLVSSLWKALKTNEIAVA